MLENKIIQGDVIEKMKEMEENCFDLIIADPPYNQGVANWDIFNRNSYWNFMNVWIGVSAKKLKKGGSMFIFNNPYNSGKTISIIEEQGLTFQNWITWYKKDGFGAPKYKFRTKQEVILFLTKGKKPNIFNKDKIREPYVSQERIMAAKIKGILKNKKRWFPNPNGALRSDVWEFSSQRHKEKVNGKVQKHWHETPKPHDLIEIIIKCCTNKDSKILDLFSGSGSTSIVAKKLNVSSIGIEINKKFVKKIQKVLENV